MYDTYFAKKYGNVTKLRGDMYNYGIGAASGLTLNYVKTPLVSFITNMSFVWANSF